MEKEQELELEWKKAQSISINVDLVLAAKTQLKFLAAVDRNRSLYEGPGLDRTIYRYNAFWLPLLAKHSESPLVEGPLAVPFDCEWIWHCHRLNPVRYKTDCEEFYGRILDNQKVASSLEGTPRKATEEIWKTLYPGEPFELDSSSALQDTIYAQKDVQKCTNYDLISAVQRQSPFFYQVSRPYMNDNRYLEGAVARYKAFLHLIKRNKERSIKSFSVPTYDIDLIWHTHQLHPVSYCKDLVQIMGKILEHDDTDSDRTKGQKLDVGFSGTTKTYEEMYGYRYWRAGAMYRGNSPSPVRTTPYSGVAKKAPTSDEYPKIALPNMNVIEVMLEFVGVRNLPEGQKEHLSVSFSKTQPDEIFNAKRSLTILSESGEKQVASFQCEPTGHLLFELMSCSKISKAISTSSIPVEDLLSQDSHLTVDKWLDLVPSSNMTDSKPVGLRVAISITIPTPAPCVFHMTRSRASLKNSCLFPLPLKVQFAKSWTRIIDKAGNLVMSLQMRDSKKSKGKQIVKREVFGIMESGETRIVAEFADSEWSLVNSPWSLQLPNTKNDDGHLLELTGPHTLRLFLGGRLDYESRGCEKHKAEREKLGCHLITAVEFSAEDPYGKAVALLDLESGSVKVKEEWFILPSFILTFILGSILRKEGYNSLNLGTKEKILSNEEISETNLTPVLKEVELNVKTVKSNAVMPVKGGGGCGGGCGSGCGNVMKSVESGGCGGSGGCGSGCGGGGRNMTKSGGCGGSGGCGSGCGGGGRNVTKSGGCGGSGGYGGGCGGGGGNMTKSGGCSGSGGCGGGCGGENMVKSGGCGGGCGGSGGCGNMAKCGGCGGGGCGGGGGGCGGGCSNKQGNETFVA